MSSFFNLIGGVLGFVVVLIVLMYINTVGIKTIGKNIVNVFKRSPSDKLRSVGYRLSNIAKDMNSEMKVIQLTTGKCDCCGETFVGTTDDDEFPIQKVEFMGESRVLCNKCLDSLIKAFRKEGKSKKKHFSENAEAFRGLLMDMESKINKD